MFDVHTHLTAPELLPNLDKLLADAHRSVDRPPPPPPKTIPSNHHSANPPTPSPPSAGVRDILVVSENLADAPLVLALPSSQQGLRLHKALGLHPEHASLAALPRMLDLIRTHHTQLACVGEIGLDFSPHVLGTTNREGVKETQRECMRQQVAVALTLDLSVNVHSRSAGHHALALLKEEGDRHGKKVRAVLHAWDGKAQYAEAAAGDTDHDFYFSVPPCAQRSPLMQKWVSRVPMERLLLETDSPALAPEKGQVNVPANLSVSCAVIAGIKGLGEEAVRATTRANAERLLGRQPGGGHEEEEGKR